MISYSVIETDSEQYLAEQVSNALSEGWTLAGQLILVIDSTGKHHFAQTLIRPDPGAILQKPGNLDPYGYEIISPFIGGKVVGVCVDPNDHDGSDDIFGALTQEQYDAFNDKSWVRPKSTKRYRLVPQPKKLEEIK